MLRHSVLSSCAFGIVLAVFATASQAQTRTLRTIVASGAGGATDTLARVTSSQIERAQKISTFVENRPGAGSIIGTEAVARMPGDGNTLLITASGFLINPILRKVNYDPLTDFTPICHLITAPAVIAVSANSPYKTLDELIKAAKTNPGKLTLGTPGPGSSHHILFEGFKQTAKVDMIYVPFRGTAKAVADMLGEHLSAVISDYGSLDTMLRSGQIRALAVSSSERMATMPDVPTLEQSGITGLNIQSWFGIVAPAKLNEGVAEELISWYRAAVADEEVIAKLTALQLTPKPICGDEFRSFLKESSAAFSRIIERGGLKLP